MVGERTNVENLILIVFASNEVEVPLVDKLREIFVLKRLLEFFIFDLRGVLVHQEIDDFLHRLWPGKPLCEFDVFFGLFVLKRRQTFYVNRLRCNLTAEAEAIAVVCNYS